MPAPSEKAIGHPFSPLGSRDAEMSWRAHPWGVAGRLLGLVVLGSGLLISRDQQAVKCIRPAPAFKPLASLSSGFAPDAVRRSMSGKTSYTCVWIPPRLRLTCVWIPSRTCASMRSHALRTSACQLPRSRITTHFPARRHDGD
jgi:hypothetical protein